MKNKKLNCRDCNWRVFGIIILAFSTCMVIGVIITFVFDNQKIQFKITKEECQNLTYTSYRECSPIECYEDFMDYCEECNKVIKSFEKQCSPVEVDEFYIENRWDVMVEINEEVLRKYPEWLDENCECIDGFSNFECQDCIKYKCEFDETYFVEVLK